MKQITHAQGHREVERDLKNGFKMYQHDSYRGTSEERVICTKYCSRDYSQLTHSYHFYNGDGSALFIGLYKNRRK